MSALLCRAVLSLQLSSERGRKRFLVPVEQLIEHAFRLIPEFQRDLLQRTNRYFCGRSMMLYCNGVIVQHAATPHSVLGVKNAPSWMAPKDVEADNLLSCVIWNDRF